MPAPKTGKMHKSTVVERVQALAMFACGKAPKDIEAVVGIAPPAFGQLLKKARTRGYVVGEKISEDFVMDGKPARMKGTVVDPGDSPSGTPTPRKAVAKAAKKPVKLEPQADQDSDMFPSQPQGNAYNAAPIPLNLQPNPFKLEPMQYDEDDYSV